jgi:hypothetical protein
MKFELLKIKGSYYLNGEKLKRIRGNSSREIWIGEKYVLKIDCYGKGSTGSKECDYQCKNEWEVWKTINKEDKKFFAKCLGFGKLNHNRYFIVQKKYLLSDRIRDYKSQKEIWAFQNILSKYNLDNDVFISSKDIGEGRGNNCAIDKISGNIICYDYGYPRN